MKKTKTSLQRNLRKALKEWIKDQGCDMKSAIRDALTDLRHICDQQDMDFSQVDRGAYQVYREEKEL